MPSIASIGTLITVTPSAELEIVLAPGTSEFLDDRTEFCVCVAGVLHEGSQIIAVFGPATSQAERYQGLVATLFVRLDDADWSKDNRSAANCKVGRTVASLHGRHPFHLPQGSHVPFPHIITYGSLDSRSEGEPEINSARDLLSHTFL